jgi:hypothetical protein
MALTETQILTVAKILGVTFTEASFYCESEGITATVEVLIEDELARWETAGADFISIFPTEANFGAKTSPEFEKQDIRKNLAVLLGVPDMIAQINTAARLKRG